MELAMADGGLAIKLVDELRVVRLGHASASHGVPRGSEQSLPMRLGDVKILKALEAAGHVDAAVVGTTKDESQRLVELLSWIESAGRKGLFACVDLEHALAEAGLHAWIIVKGTKFAVNGLHEANVAGSKGNVVVVYEAGECLAACGEPPRLELAGGELPHHGAEFRISQLIVQGPAMDEDSWIAIYTTYAELLHAVEAERALEMEQGETNNDR